MSLTLNPLEVVDYERSNAALQEFWLFCLLVAGKNSDWAAKKVEQFREVRPRGVGVFTWFSTMDNKRIRETLIDFRTGQYKRLTDAIVGTLELRLERPSALKRVGVDTLQSIPGVGPKTARMFVLFTQRGARHAILDTHVLRWLSLRRLDLHVPKSTPQGKKEYHRLEEAVIEELQKEFPGHNLAQADLQIWARMSGRE